MGDIDDMIRGDIVDGTRIDIMATITNTYS